MSAPERPEWLTRALQTYRREYAEEALARRTEFHEESIESGVTRTFANRVADKAASLYHDHPCRKFIRNVAAANADYAILAQLHPEHQEQYSHLHRVSLSEILGEDKCPIRAELDNPLNWIGNANDLFKAVGEQEYVKIVNAINKLIPPMLEEFKTDVTRQRPDNERVFWTR